MTTPKQDGFHFPAEWHEQEATWLSFPQNSDTWEGSKRHNLYPAYFQFIKEIAEVEKVRLNIGQKIPVEWIKYELNHLKANLGNIEIFTFPVNDAWARDFGAGFVINPNTKQKAIVNWEYNAWGGKYPPFDSDNAMPSNIAKHFGLKMYSPNIVMEGGSVDFNGQGTVLTTTDCLLNKNRNPHLSQKEIENYLCEYYGVSQVIWLGEGIVGDDTDGHVDDITRFVNENTVITVIENDKNDANYHQLHENLEKLQNIILHNGKKLEVIILPMPTPHYIDEERLPASYANFLIVNEKVLVPIFKSENDTKALGILQDCFPKRKVIGIDASQIVWGLGTLHCLSQQEPRI